jgi:hypothetical protein
METDPVRRAIDEAHRLAAQADTTGWKVTVLGISLAVAGLKQNADSAKIAQRFPRFIWAFNDALEKCLPGQFVIEAAKAEPIVKQDDDSRMERMAQASSGALAAITKSKLTMRDSTMVGATLAISGLAENATPDVVIERFPTFVDMLNMALETYQSGKLTIEATVLKTATPRH